MTGWDRYRDQRSDDDLAQLFTPLLFYHDSEQGTSDSRISRRWLRPDTAGLVWLAGVSYYANEYRRGMGGERPMFGPERLARIHSAVAVTAWYLLLALPGQLGIHDSGVDTDYYSAFGQVTWAFGDHLSLTGNLRWQTEEKRAWINNSVTLPGVSLIANVLTPFGESERRTGQRHHFTQYRLSDLVPDTAVPHKQRSDDLLDGNPRRKVGRFQYRIWQRTTLCTRVR